MKVSYISMPQGHFKTAPAVRLSSGRATCTGCAGRVVAPDFDRALCVDLNAEGPHCCNDIGHIFVDDPDWAEHQVPVTTGVQADIDAALAGLAVSEAEAEAVRNISAQQVPWMMVAPPMLTVPPMPMARTSDPVTSHEAAAATERKGGKLIGLLIQALRDDAALCGAEAIKGSLMPIGLNGKELSTRTGVPLNSITPRLAPLRRAGLIHAKSRRDKQIVWALGNGIAA